MSEEIVDPKRLLIPSLGRIYNAGSKYSYAFMRFCTGAVLVPHGIQKLLLLPPDRYAANIAQHGIPGATALAWAMVFAESFCAVFVALGLFTRFAAAAIRVEMAVIIIFFQSQFGYFWTNRGIEYALLWLLLCTAILFRGGGRYALDHYLGCEL